MWLSFISAYIDCVHCNVWLWIDNRWEHMRTIIVKLSNYIIITNHFEGYVHYMDFTNIITQLGSTIGFK